MTNKTITIGTRGSELALWQTHWVKRKLLEKYPHLKINIEIMKTTGDKILDVSLSKIGDKGLFTKELEKAILDGDIDMAVHSLKDLPTKLPDGLAIGAVSEREDQRDAFISDKYDSIESLPQNAVIGTGSLRRRGQLKNYRNDIRIEELRGNVQTRLRKLAENDWDGIILAYAGLKRLGLEERVKQVIPLEIMLPAVSQGVMAVEIRENDNELKELLHVINNMESFYQIEAERSFLRKLEGGCQIPIGAYTKINGVSLNIEGVVTSIDGSKLIRDNAEGKLNNAAKTGEELAEKLLEKGADKILAEIRSNI